jgi:hypothetical protein
MTDPRIIARLEDRIARLRSWLESIRDVAPDLETAQRLARVGIDNDDREEGSSRE